jgi:hypothetical protein
MFCKHPKYIKTKNTQCAYASHILNHRYKYGFIPDIMELTVPTHKRLYMNCLENLYIQFHQPAVLIINKKCTGEFNPVQNNAQCPTATHMHIISTSHQSLKHLHYSSVQSVCSLCTQPDNIQGTYLPILYTSLTNLYRI